MWKSKAARNGLLHAFPPLTQDAQCEIAVVGGGITGLLVARELAANGHDVVVPERREYGWAARPPAPPYCSTRSTFH